MANCWERRGCDDEMMERCPHNQPDLPADCHFAACHRATHVVASDFGLLLNPERDYEAAIKEVCRFCEHFLKNGPDVADGDAGDRVLAIPTASCCKACFGRPSLRARRAETPRALRLAPCSRPAPCALLALRLCLFAQAHAARSAHAARRPCFSAAALLSAPILAFAASTLSARPRAARPCPRRCVRLSFSLFELR